MGSTTFGSTQEDNDPDYCTAEDLGLTRQEKITMEGMMARMDLMQQKFENMSENLTKLVGLVMTLQGRLEAINDARVRELQLRGTGPTVIPDANDSTSNT